MRLTLRFCCRLNFIIRWALHEWDRYKNTSGLSLKGTGSEPLERPVAQPQRRATPHADTNAAKPQTQPHSQGNGGQRPTGRPTLVVYSYTRHPQTGSGAGAGGTQTSNMHYFAARGGFEPRDHLSFAVVVTLADPHAHADAAAHTHNDLGLDVGDNDGISFFTRTPCYEGEGEGEGEGGEYGDGYEDPLSLDNPLLWIIVRPKSP